MARSEPATEAIASKTVNALFQDVALSDRAGAAADAIKAGLVATNILGRSRQSHGGLWVGGTATLTRTGLTFEPNALNRALHKGDMTVRIPLKDIKALTLEWGFLTKIVAIETAEFTVRMRCYGAAEFMRKIREASGKT